MLAWQGLTFFSLCSLGGYLPPPAPNTSPQSCSPITFLGDTSSELNLVVSREYLLDLTTFTLLQRVRVNGGNQRTVEYFTSLGLLFSVYVAGLVAGFLPLFRASHISYTLCIFMGSVFALSVL